MKPGLKIKTKHLKRNYSETSAASDYEEDRLHRISLGKPLKKRQTKN